MQTYWAALALVRGAPDLTVQHAELALARAADDDHLSIASASAVLGLAAWAAGDLETAHRGYRTAMERLEQAGHIADVLGCSVTVGDIEITQGRLRDARQTFDGALELAGTAELRGIADMHVGLSRVAWESGDLPAVAEHLRVADEAGDACGLPQYPYRWRVMMARLRHAQGDTATALELLDEAERAYVSDFLPNVQPVAATRARLLTASGDLAAARAWAEQYHLSAADEATYLREYEHLTLTSILLAEHEATSDPKPLEDAARLLTRLLGAAQQGGRNGTVVETLVLQARAQNATSDQDAALSTLARAAQMAEDQGQVRAFAEGGPTVRALLAELSRRQPQHTFVQQLLNASGAGATRRGPARPHAEAPHPGGTGPEPRTVAPEHITEQLSGRETDVLRLLGSDLSGPDIARQLHVSLATVRTHTQHIYAKLGVNNRRAAVRRAHQLDLFPRAGR